MLTNPKISRFTRPSGESLGVTVLFQHPGEHLVQVGPDLYRLHCQVAGDDRLRVYQGLSRGWSEVSSTPLLLGAAPVDCSALHVTFADVFHSGNIDRAREPQRRELKAFFEGLPYSLQSGWPTCLRAIEPLLETPFVLRLIFDRVRLFGQALVALLRPADDEALRVFDDLVERRRAIDEALSEVGKPPNPRFQPHVTLAYLPDDDSAARVESALAGWQAIFQRATRDYSLEFHTASLFAFTSMLDFRTRRRAPAALFVGGQALNQDRSLGSKGFRKVSVTSLYQGEELATDPEWSADPARRAVPVSITENLEIAYFNERARQDPHYHRYCTEIYTVLQGGPMTIVVDGRPFQLAAGESILVHPGAVHLIVQGDGGAFLAQVVAVNSRGTQDKYVVPKFPPSLEQHFAHRRPPLVPNVTMVAYYGRPKPQALMDLIDEIVGVLQLRLGALFTPYRPAALHSTWIGLEGVRMSGHLFNVNAAANGKGEKAMDFDGFARFARELSSLTLRYGGFGPDCECGAEERKSPECHRSAAFHSCCRSPYEGTFYASANSAVVLTGWPTVRGTADQFPRTAFTFRDAAEQFGIVDKYHYRKDEGPNVDRHPRSSWENDDCGMTLGYLGDAPAQSITAVVAELREMLSDPRKRLDVTLSQEDFAFVKYRDTGLAQIEAIIPAPEITGTRLASLYADIGW